ncbi:aminotransferase class V-fold PLP-dependent enzyme [Corynebacterium argentoratense]|uniref:aminotransferase class V-fold PLP-dependent enzyme n=1 Tax=Corynebacterium argentoratense TaxID=42817 RepID=UPI001F1B06AC|nr:aminotransferase class V-fold PLP-dependent enzyme [Corynebacterium argentoratense]MCF1694049.1 aminotransferase class V-fold PLP-dependent enzyme [Corynebacterium argentoratense]MCF1735620.1 aminotransferase class V-fold PLP-dependent enzyme [Corynebacterium argentoratense]
MPYDVAFTRGLYSSLSDGWIYLNGQSAPQIPEKVSSAVATAFRTSAQIVDPEPVSGSHSRALQQGLLAGSHHVVSARKAIADLVGARPDCVFLGPNRESMVASFIRAMRRRVMRPGSGAVLTSSLSSSVYDVALDAVSAPGTQRAAHVRTALADLGSGYVDEHQFTDLVDGSTRLVVIPAAHSLVGTVTDVPAIAEIVRSKSRAWTLVDASMLAPYRPISFETLGVDALVVDCAAFGGPQVAALVLRDTSMLQRLEPVGGSLEHGALSSGLLGGVSAMADHLASLGGEPTGTRRRRLARALEATATYVDELNEQLLFALQNLSHVHVVGVSGDAVDSPPPAGRIGRVSFVVPGVDADTVHRRLLNNGVVTEVNPPDRLLEAMGAQEAGGSVSVGLAPYNTAADITALARALASLG